MLPKPEEEEDASHKRDPSYAGYVSNCYLSGITKIKWGGGGPFELIQKAGTSLFL